MTQMRLKPLRVRVNPSELRWVIRVLDVPNLQGNVQEDLWIRREVHIAIKLYIMQKYLIGELDLLALLPDLVLGQDLEDHPRGELRGELEEVRRFIKLRALNPPVQEVLRAVVH